MLKNIDFLSPQYQNMNKSRIERYLAKGDALFESIYIFIVASSVRGMIFGKKKKTTTTVASAKGFFQIFSGVF